MRFRDIVVVCVGGAVVFGIVALKIEGDREDKRRTEVVETTSDPAEFVRAIITAERAAPAASVAGHTLSIEYRIDGVTPSVKSMAPMHDINVRRIAQNAFRRFPQIDTLTVTARAEMVDIRGHSSVDKVAVTTFTRKTASQINWPGVQSDNIAALADADWRHPALKSL